MSAPKYRIFELPNGMWRLSINGGVDALDASVLWLKASETDFGSFQSAREGLQRAIERRQYLFDEAGNSL